MKKIILSAITLLLFAGAASAADYVERNILRSQADEAKLKTLLIPDQKWVPFPAYGDRAGWDKVLGEWKDEFIARGEDALDYKWKVITATDYLTHDRGGSQGDANASMSSNVMKIIDLFFAELATGQGKYMDQLMNGTFNMCEATSWVLSHHLYLQKSGHYFPQSYDNAIDLVCGDVGAVMAWVYYYFHNEFDKIEPEISRR
ncbi:MAG: heparinase, partial [Bacteroidales bacterium]|nr:heparinase [Bacteroidales bacterium]